MEIKVVFNKSPTTQNLPTGSPIENSINTVPKQGRNFSGKAAKADKQESQ